MQAVMLPTSTGPAPENLTKHEMRDLSRDLEAAFLSEMLKHAGLGQAPEGFGGGAGEAQFGSLLRDMQARQMVDSGGIGLAEMIYKSLEARAND